MSYQEREHPLGDRRNDEFFTLYVNNLPDELNEDGIAQIFKVYGQICSLFMPPKAHWAFISYKTYKEAEHAIRALNERSPLFLKVAFRKNFAKNQSSTLPQENGVPVEQRDYRYVENGSSDKPAPRTIMPEVLASNVAQMCREPGRDVNSVYPSDLDPNVYNPFESAGRYAGTNAMWSRGCVSIDEFGKRYVSMGRGYTKYQIPEPAYSQIEHQIGRVYENREPGFYQYGKDRLQYGIGSCQYCGHAAKLRCAKCEDYYCSQQCQFVDWPRHKLECKKIPALIGEMDGASMTALGKDEPTPVPRKPRVITKPGSVTALRRPKTITISGNPYVAVDAVAPTSEMPTETKLLPEDEPSESSFAPKNDVPPTIEGARSQADLTQKFVEKAVPESPKRAVDCARDSSKLQQQRHVENDRGSESSRAGSTKRESSKQSQQNLPSGTSNGRAASVKSSNSTKTDYRKQEEDLAFPRDPRGQVKMPEPDEKSTSKLQHTIDNLNVGDVGYLQVYVALDNTSYAVCVLSSDFMEWYQMIYETMTAICNQSRKPENFSPSIGDFVCGKRDDIWLRGHVLSLGPPIRLALVDEARVAPVVEAMPMPADYEKICAFGAIVTLDAVGPELTVDVAGQFQVTEVIDEAGGRIVKGVLVSPDELKDVRFAMKNWQPTPEQKGIGFAELQNNSEVCISSYQNERTLFLRGLDSVSLERIHRITQSVAKWAQKAPKLEENPVVGQLVIAKFVDDNYYRAIVTKVLDGKIGVSYIDYGNAEITTINQLRLLSDELKGEKSCASKVILKNVKEGAPPTKEVHQYLDLLVGTEQPLICTFEGIPSKDGVTLMTSTGECVNDKVNTCLTPVWQREDPSKNLKCFMMEDLEVAALGEVGQTVKALPLFATEPPFKYVMAPFDKEHLTHVTEIQPELIQAYCESTKEHYIPRTFELCLAVWEGAWYRGACINRNATSTQALIYFVDYGNEAIVDHTNIRQMTRDFMSSPALGTSCLVTNLGIQTINGKVPEPVLRRIDELVPLNDLVDVKIVKKSSADDAVPLAGDYEIELPSVREKLVAEGLAKP